MGGGASRLLIFAVNERVNGQGPEVLRTFEALHIAGQDVDKYWTSFNALNFDASGFVTLERFHKYYRLQQTAFTEKVFSVMDLDSSGKINFNEFVVSTWNYLSSDVDVLAAFAFSLFDSDNSRTLEATEVRSMVSMVYGGDLSRVLNVLDKLDDLRNSEGLIERREFVIFSRKYPLLLFPAYSIQLALRRSIIGEMYWEKATELRNRLYFGLTIFDILNTKNRKPKKFNDSFNESLSTKSNKTEHIDLHPLRNL